MFIVNWNAETLSLIFMPHWDIGHFPHLFSLWKLHMTPKSYSFHVYHLLIPSPLLWQFAAYFFFFPILSHLIFSQLRLEKLQELVTHPAFPLDAIYAFHFDSRQPNDCMLSQWSVIDQAEFLAILGARGPGQMRAPFVYIWNEQKRWLIVSRIYRVHATCQATF